MNINTFHLYLCLTFPKSDREGENLIKICNHEIQNISAEETLEYTISLSVAALE